MNLGCPTFLICNPHFHPGGFSSHALNLATSLRRLGCGSKALITDPVGPLAGEFHSAFDSVITLPRGLTGRTRYVERTAAAVNEAAPCVVLNNSVPFCQAALPYFSRKIVSFSVLHSTEDAEVRCATAHNEHQDGVVAVSSSCRTALLSRFPDTNVTVIPVGVPIDKERRRHLPPGNPVRLAYVGRISSRAKNLTALVKVLDGLHQERVPFCCSFVGTGDFLPFLSQEISARRYASQVRFLGYQPPSKIRAFLPSQDILLLTSEFEGTPHVVLEAMASGVPVVASRIPGSTEDILDHGRTGFLCEINNIEAYVHAIQRLRDDNQLFQQVADAAFTVVKVKYSAERSAGNYKALWESAAQARATRPTPTSAHLCSEIEDLCPSLLRHARSMLGRYIRNTIKTSAP